MNQISQKDYTEMICKDSDKEIVHYMSCLEVPYKRPTMYGLSSYY